MTRSTALLAALVIGLVSGSALAETPSPFPVVVARERVTYRCAGGSNVVALYYGLADGSLDFVRLERPEARPVTLPRLVSASGVRYSDDAHFQWWSKGEAGFLQERSSNGRWSMAIQDCRRRTGPPWSIE
jgi:membrane-bound inhibitor of C-type lysozyme